MSLNKAKIKFKLMLNHFLKHTFATNVKKSSPKFMNQYRELIEKHKTLEMVLPREVKSTEELENCGFINVRNDYYATSSKINSDQIDLNFFNRTISDPSYHQFTVGNDRTVPILAMIFANDFGANLYNFEENKLLYYLIACTEIFLQSICITDNIEDQSLKRWGNDCTYIKYGTNVAINASSFLNFICFSRLKLFMSPTDRKYSQFIDHFTEACIKFRLGQSWDMDWLRCSFIPKETNYYQMSSCKVGGIFMLTQKLMCTLYNTDPLHEAKLANMMHKFSIAFQINNDLVSLVSSEYAVARGILSDDIREGKRSLIVIHSYNNLNEISKKRLLDILSMKTENIELIEEAIELLNSTKSIEYAKNVKQKVIKTMIQDSLELLQKDESKINFEKICQGNLRLNLDILNQISMKYFDANSYIF